MTGTTIKAMWSCWRGSVTADFERVNGQTTEFPFLWEKVKNGKCNLLDGCDAGDGIGGDTREKERECYNCIAK